MPLRTRATLVLALLTVAGCDSLSDAPSTFSPDAGPETAFAAPTSLQTVPASATVNGYTVAYLGATATAAGTEFSYEVTGIDPGPPALDWFFLENACGTAPAAIAPSNAADLSFSVDGLTGVKWNASVSGGTTRVYRYTFPGATVGVIRAKVRRGGVTATAALPGPCGGYRLGGSAFVDGDGDGARSGSELGLGNVRVEVYQNGTFVAAEATAPDGSFAFRLAEGRYEVRLPASASGAFNATLYGSYAASGGVEPASRTVDLRADVSGAGFGFVPEGSTVIADLTTGAYKTQARDVRFWRDAIRRASREAACDASDPNALCRDRVLGLLAQIFSGDGDGVTYLLDEPYRLPSGVAPLDHAAALLAGNPRGGLELVTQNLFAMELNRLNGWGSPDTAYDDALLTYLEGWVARGGSGAAGSSATASASGMAYATAGGGGGGGGVEERMTTAYLGGGGGGGGVEE